MSQITLSKEQLEYLFPYFIIFDKNLCISDCSLEISNQFGLSIDTPLSQYFTIVEPIDSAISFDSLLTQTHPNLKLQVKN
ncbi:MAG: hypothetical protein H7325_08565, partial [Pedobacter sp.]|nr:hypothetical protein [Pedobacter sp.]